MAHYQEGLGKFSIDLDLEAKPIKGNRSVEKVSIFNPGGTTAIYTKTAITTDNNNDLELDLSDFTGDRNQNYDIKIEMSN